MTRDGIDLLTVVMHELGHLLGYEHSDDEHDLMAPVLASGMPGADSLSPDLSLDHSPLYPSGRASSFVPRPSSLTDEVFADLIQGGSEDASAELVESGDGLLAALPLPEGERATEMRIPRRSRMARYQRELDAWFAELAAVEDGGKGHPARD